MNHYTSADDSMLCQMWNEDRTISVMALVLKRSKDSIKNRVKKLGLSPRANPVKNAVYKPKPPRLCRGCGCEMKKTGSNHLYCREGCARVAHA